MTDPVVGFSVRREANEPAPPSDAHMSVIGLCRPAAKASDALQADFDAAFPLNTPVLFASTSDAAALIDPDDGMGQAISLINAQLGPLQASAQIVFVRVAEGVDDDATMANIVGDSAAGTGINAFKRAGAEIGVIPRLIAAPGFTHQLDGGTNPVAVALPAILNAILAIAVVDTGGADRDADVTYRETLSSDRIMVVAPAVKTQDSAGDPVTLNMTSAAVLGLFVRRDFANEARPFNSVMNQPVYGITGPGRAIDFNLVDGSSEGQDLLSHQVGVIVRGESGNDFAIADGGFVFMGFENTGADTIWRQIHKVRGRDYIELTAIRTLRQYLGKFRLTTQTIQAIVNTVTNILAKAENRQEILGFTCRYDPVENNEDDLRAGAITVDMRFEEAPVFRKATLLSRPDSTALTRTIEELAASADLIG